MENQKKLNIEIDVINTAELLDSYYQAKKIFSLLKEKRPNIVTVILCICLNIQSKADGLDVPSTYIAISKLLDKIT